MMFCAQSHGGRSRLVGQETKTPRIARTGRCQGLTIVGNDRLDWCRWIPPIEEWTNRFFSQVATEGISNSSTASVVCAVPRTHVIPLLPLLSLSLSLSLPLRVAESTPPFVFNSTITTLLPTSIIRAEADPMAPCNTFKSKSKKRQPVGPTR
ncbi:hypothetical protein P170DRAFT_98517 [Aspergillus steynii IBT 23096]|uniref:Uncharacterized protein n=1 Tax=Aspergillus steynii IBT 23096 TaxID=1392250 RepID=A0A2I2GH33_9EURO|nr:uncharacterized protein P170DRAFT_98517 [Aspergillus steynii IBT 23096]PLB52188.1 hypothetical protein P170DRAFT_98517 [Aspergillus steynii IBT 23096]